MDTSETYIKMCDCEEIQGIRPSLNPKEAPNNFWGHYKIGIPSLHPLWLPRQDQLQEMVANKDISVMVDDIHWFFFEGDLGFLVESMEQLWLAFYMHETHSKTWTDSNVWNSR